MKFTIKHETKCRMRIHVAGPHMSYAQADTLLYYLQNQDQVTFAKVYERTADAVIEYVGERSDIIMSLRKFHYSEVEVPAEVIQNSGRKMNADYQEKLVTKVALHYASKWFLPCPVRAYCNMEVTQVSERRYCDLMES